jgi:hypothetical protein
MMWPVCKGGKKHRGRHARRARDREQARQHVRESVREMGVQEGKCLSTGIQFGILTRALPSSIRVIMEALMFTLNSAYAMLSKPTLISKAQASWNFLGAHVFSCFRPGLLIGCNVLLFW